MNVRLYVSLSQLIRHTIAFQRYRRTADCYLSYPYTSCIVSRLRFFLLFFFFFQAEDGIRDLTVTGVQTCALPIYLRHVHQRRRRHGHRGELDRLELQGEVHRLAHPQDDAGLLSLAEAHGTGGDRSEERRVGKEGRSRWSPDH